MNAMRRLYRRGGTPLLTALLFAACSDGPAAPPVPATLAANGAIPGTATVGSVLTPSVLVTDENGNPVEGTTVTFTVTAGGGSVTNASAASNASGIASAGNWTLGTTTGANTLVASFGSLTPVTITVNTTPGTATTLVRVTIAAQSGVAGEPVTVPPSVRAQDAFGNVVAGASVTFAVTTGGGSVTGATQTTSTAGVATVGSWTLGATPGANTLTATVTGGGSAEFTATGLDEGSVSMAKFTGDDTTCPVNRDGCVFSVRVTTAGGAAVPGETIVWSNGTATTVITVTNSRGIASSGNIAPNNATGARTQTAVMQSTGASVTFDYTLVADGGYTIDIRYIGSTPTAGVQAAFTQARERWEEIVTGDLQNIQMVTDSATCGIEGLELNEVVDDLLILAVVDSIDGAGQILGSAGPCYIRGTGALPVVGVMRLDSADLAVLESNGGLADVVTHELGHTLGFPALWGDDFFGLLQDSATENAYFSGTRAAADHIVAGGTLVNDTGVPVENTGGSGTRNGHWRESVLSSEMMTGYISGTNNPLSMITVGSLMDLGYQVNFGAADPYLLPGASAFSAARGPVLELKELPLPAPRIVR